MNKPTIVVTGLGRCGTSLMMQMLHAGGVPCVGIYPAFEEHFTQELLNSSAGKALKILDPQRERPAFNANTWVIRLTRDHREQARSSAKFLALTMGMPVNRGTVRSIESSYGPDERKISGLIEHIERNQCLQLSFEELIEAPDRATKWVAAFLERAGISLDETAARAQVRARSTACAPGLDLEIALLTGLGPGEYTLKHNVTADAYRATPPTTTKEKTS